MLINRQIMSNFQTLQERITNSPEDTALDLSFYIDNPPASPPSAITSTVSTIESPASLSPLFEQNYEAISPLYNPTSDATTQTDFQNSNSAQQQLITEFNAKYDAFQNHLRNPATQTITNTLTPPAPRKFSNEFSPPDMINYYGPGIHQVEQGVHLIHHYLDPFEPKPLCALVYLNSGDILCRHYCHQHWPQRNSYNILWYGPNIPAPDTTDCNLPGHYPIFKK